MKRKAAVLLGLIMTVSMIAGCGNAAADVPVVTPEETKPSAVELALESYDTVITSLSADSWYAFADMDKDHDALLVAKKDFVFDNGDGTMAATEATVYGYDQNGRIKEYGYVAGGGTATPLAAKDSTLFYGGRDYMNKVHIEEASSEMVTEEGAFFDEYENAVVIAFTPVDASAAGGKSAGVDLPAPYFVKGVYMYYPKDDADPSMDDFYIFQDEKWGHTENGTTGMGLPFDCEQADGQVKFTYGGAGESADVFTVEALENRAVIGAFSDGKTLVFLPVDDADPDSFSAENYINAKKGEDFVYVDANGWSVKYDPSCIAVNGGGPLTTFVYTGECAGTCMVSVSYDVGKDAKTAIEDTAKEWGDQAQITERPFPVAGDKNAYWVDANPGVTGPGMYEMAVALDHMDGYLLVDIITHVGGDDAIDIPVSDALEEIIDTFTIE